ncbi:MAG: hypothetical protein ACPGVC_05780 [Salibacteraceae bacterium]
MKILGIILVFGLLFFNGCKKEEYHTTVKGKVIHSSTKLPIEGVTVVIENEVSFNPSHLDSTVTNENGYFHLELPNENGAWVYLKKMGYTFHYSSLDNVTGYLTSYPNGVTENVVLEMYSEATFKPILQGVSPSINDSLFFERLTYDKDHNGRMRSFTGLGPFIPYDNGGYIRGDTYTYYWLRYKLQGSWTERIDSVFVKSFETFTDTIYY